MLRLLMVLLLLDRHRHRRARSGERQLQRPVHQRTMCCLMVVLGVRGKGGCSGMVVMAGGVVMVVARRSSDWLSMVHHFQVSHGSRASYVPFVSRSKPELKQRSGAQPILWRPN